jgi:hypothetical protein
MAAATVLPSIANDQAVMFKFLELLYGAFHIRPSAE